MACVDDGLIVEYEGGLERPAFAGYGGAAAMIVGV